MNDDDVVWVQGPRLVVRPPPHPPNLADQDNSPPDHPVQDAFQLFMQAFPLARNLNILTGALPGSNRQTAGQANGPRQPALSGLAGGEKKLMISPEDWEARLARAKITRVDMNKLVMNYLSTEGYKEAAEQFAAETGVRSPMDFETIEARMRVREAIQSGDISNAIGLINDLDPEILDYNPRIVFHLYQQQLIELIRAGKTNEALDFAQEELAPKGESSPDLLPELERTMALLVLEPSQVTEGSELFDPYHRVRLANEVNAAILQSQGHGEGAKLPALLKLLMWSQEQLASKAAFPCIVDLAEGRVEFESIE